MRSRIAGSYGIDAPIVPALSAAGALIMYVIAAFSQGVSYWVSLLCALLLTVQVVLYLHTSMRGKFVVWRRLLSSCPVPPNAHVLDIGCGRGMVIITAMMQFPTAHGVGIDLWRSRDQSGNDPQAALSNAAANGVAERIDLQTQDMSALDFPDESFDLVTANVAIQNVKNRDRRRDTIEHMYRVLKPGGHIYVVDIQYLGQHEDDLKSLGAVDVEIRSLGPIVWWGNPFYASRLLLARKPFNPAAGRNKRSA